MKLGIVGSGFIITEVLEALKLVKNVEVTAICVRAQSKAKGDDFAARYHIPAVYTDYDQFLQEADMDFAYIGIVNNMHFDYTEDALRADRNVILEKPFTSTAAEAKELIELAKKRHLFLFEAVSPLHMPNFAKLQEVLPQIGRVTMVQANYSQYSSRYGRYLEQEVLPAFDPKYSGGALYDINIYNLNIIIGLFGSPQEISYTANIGFNGIDTSGVAILKYPDFIAVAVGAKDSGSPSGVIIQGEKGWIRCEGAPNEQTSVELCVRPDPPQKFELNLYPHRLCHEFEEFANFFDNKDFGARDKYLDISLQVAEAAEKARRSADIKFAADAE